MKLDISADDVIEAVKHFPNIDPATLDLSQDELTELSKAMHEKVQPFMMNVLRDEVGRIIGSRPKVVDVPAQIVQEPAEDVTDQKRR